MLLSAQLNQKRMAALASAQKLVDAAQAANGDMTPEAKTAFDGHMADVKRLDGEIEGALNFEKVQAANAQPQKRLTGETAVSNGMHDNQRDDPVRGFTKGVGEFMNIIHRKVTGGIDDNRLQFLGAAGDPTLQQGIASDGGYLIPPSFSTAIYDAMTKMADSLEQFCDKYTIPYGTESMTFPADAETSRADGSRAGGIQGYWKSELAQMTATRPTLREIKLAPQELYVFGFISDKLLQNAPIFSQYFTNKAADELKFKINNAIMNGTGAGQPKGVLSSNAMISVAKEVGQAGATIVRQNIQKMWRRMMPRCRKNAIWFIDTSCESELENLTIAVGTGGTPLMFPATGMSGDSYDRMKGRPIMPIEYCGALGDNGDVVLADLSGYALGVRGGVDTQMSMHLKFDFAQTAFRLITEIDGTPWLNSALTPFTPAGGTTKSETLSCFTSIAARA